MSPNQASSLSLPIPSGRATSIVGAPDGVSAGALASDSQGTASVFDTLVAALAPAAPTEGPVTDDQATEDSPLSAASLPTITVSLGQITDAPAETAVEPAPPQPATLPQPVVDVQSVQPQPVAAAPILPTLLLAAAKAADASQIAADAAIAEAPAQAQPAAETATVTPVAGLSTAPQPAEAPASETPAPETQATAAPARSAAAKIRAAHDARTDKAKDDKAADAGGSAPAPVTADSATQSNAVAPVQPQMPLPTQAPAQAVSAQTSAATQPVNTAPVPALQIPALKPATGVAAAFSTSDKTDDSATTTDKPVSQTAASADPGPAQTQQRPVDALAGSLKAVRKALTADADAQGADAAPRATAPSAFALQAQAEAPGAYTATGAQTAGTTQAGSNLARATVETLSNMSVQIHRKMSEGNTTFAVELHPADLGKVEVTLTMTRDGTTTAHLKFDTPVTAAAFQAQEGELRRQLAQTGLNVDQGALTFSSRDDNANTGGFNQAFAQMQQQNQPQGQQNRQSRSQARAFQDAAAVAADADSNAAIDAGLLALRAGVSSTLALNLIV